jgi:D-alanine transaminase
MMADVLWFNGRFTTTDERPVGIEDRGFQFGDAVYEAMKFVDRSPLLVAEHYRRMCASLEALEIPNVWSAEEFVALCRELIARSEFDSGLIYVQLSRGECERAHFYPEGLKPTALAHTRRFNFPSAGKKEKGISLITVPDIRWKLAWIKSTNLLPNALMKKRAEREGADEALFVDDGAVREGASSNFFGVIDGRIITHPLDHQLLAGTVRDQVITLAIASHIRVDERALRSDEIVSLDEAFATSTSLGVMPVREIDRRPVGNGLRGAITARLQELYEQFELSEVAKYRR